MLSLFAGGWTGFWSGAMAAYLAALLLGLLVPSWPFNLFFTPLALVALAVQTLQWRWLGSVARRAHLPGLLLGSLCVAGVWTFYFQG